MPARIAYGKRLVAMEETATGVTARFEDGTKAAGEFLVGADGVNSRVRDIILPEGPKPAFTGLVGTGGFLPRSSAPLKHGESEATMGLYFGDGRFFGYGFGDRGEANGAFWWTALERDTPIGDTERAAITFDQVRDGLLLEAANWDERVRQIVDATTRYIPPLNIFDVASLPYWSRGRVVLIGDAAHAVSPHSGQGASMALEDAIVLAKRLREKPHEITAAFRDFEAERRERVERIVAYGRRSGDTKKKRGPVAAWMQRLLMPLFIRLAGRGMRWVYSYCVRWEEEVEEVRQAA
jgi:2-polyprenyl-6-methoxyphenol hydroxylase-like FAD-dependent oxidoreductase